MHLASCEIVCRLLREGESAEQSEKDNVVKELMEKPVTKNTNIVFGQIILLKLKVNYYNQVSKAQGSPSPPNYPQKSSSR